MKSIEPSKNQSITLTDTAAAKLYELLLAEKNPALKLRVFATGGGCGGVQFGFSFEDEAMEGDTVIKREVITDQERQFVTLLVDPVSLPYLQGADMDFVDDTCGEQFVIRNAPVSSGCGGCRGSCGGCGDGADGDA